MRHSGTYFVPICGGEYKFDLDVRYDWTDEGPELTSIRFCIDIDWHEMQEWPDELARQIGDQISRDHMAISKYEEEVA